MQYKNYKYYNTTIPATEVSPQKADAHPILMLLLSDLSSERYLICDTHLAMLTGCSRVPCNEVIFLQDRERLRPPGLRKAIVVSSLPQYINYLKVS